MKKILKPIVLTVMVAALIVGWTVINSVNVRVAKIMTVQGDVQVKRVHTDQWIEAKADMRLYEGDEVKTFTKSKVVIQLDDGSITQLTSLSNMTMDKLSRSLKGKSTNMEMGVGKSWMKVKKIQVAKDKFNVGTPTAVAGVRGTYFSTEVEQTTDSAFDVFEGEINVAQRSDPAEQVAVRTNNRTEVKRGNAPTAPRNIPKDELQQALQDGISDGLSGESGAYDMQIKIDPQTLPAGGKGVVTVQFLENGKPYNGAVTFTLSLGGSATFVDNGAQTIEINSNEKGFARLEVTSTAKEEISVGADVAFETRE